MLQASIVFIGGSGLFRRGLNSFLDDSPFTVASEHDTVAECIQETRDSHPDVVIYISNGVVNDTVESVEAVTSEYPDVRVLVLAADLSLEELGECLRAGTTGYLLSTISKKALRHSLTLLMLGEMVFPSALATALPQCAAKRPKISARLRGTLTPRELDILRCLTEGASNKLIARDLGITESTVKIHMKSLIRKIGAQNRTQAALWAIESGFGREGIHNAA